ncbi:B12-binding domain-containing radical SAM protein, partial [bacterium]|nr:B12-binding domain-containing radical SAM protein [bacterium]
MPASMVSKETWISPPPRSGGMKVAVAYPNSYRVGMPNLGYQAILRTFLEDHRFDARRVFWDGRSLSFPDGGRSLEEFDVIALSVSFQPDMVHLPRLLEAGRVGLENPITRPLLIGGGVAVTINPETCHHLFDLIVLGDAEPVLPILKDQLLVVGPDSDRAAFLDSMVRVPGVYLPGRYKGEPVPGSPFLRPRPDPGTPSTIVTAAMSDLDDNPARPAVVSTDSEFGSLYPLEVSRGCPAGCLFCAAGSVCGPVRFLGMDAFVREAELGLGYRKTIGLVGTAVSYHPGLEEMAAYLLEQEGSFSPSSIRAERVTPKLAALLVAARHRTVSLAPEAGTVELRSAIGKRFSDEQFLDRVDILLDAGIPNLKLYFMVGLPKETDSDIEGIVELAVKLRERMLHFGRPRGKVGTLTISVNPFVPKPRTAFERVPMAAESILNGRMKTVRSRLGPVGGVRVQTGSVRGAYLDALLSLGDRSVADVLDNLPAGGVSMKRLTKIIPAAEQILYGRESGELPW